MTTHSTDDVCATSGVYELSHADHKTATGEERRRTFLMAAGLRVPACPYCDTPAQYELLGPVPHDQRVVAAHGRMLTSIDDDREIRALLTPYPEIYRRMFGSDP